MAKTETCFGLAAGVDAAEDLDFAGVALGEEEIAVGREADEARVVETGGVELDLESLGRDGPGVGGAGNDVGAVVDGLLGHGLGQVGDGEMAAGAGGFVSRISECGLAGKDGVPGCGTVRAGGGVCGRGDSESGCEDGKADDGRSDGETVQVIHETSLGDGLREVGTTFKNPVTILRCGGGMARFKRPDLRLVLFLNFGCGIGEVRVRA